MELKGLPDLKEPPFLRGRLFFFLRRLDHQPHCARQRNATREQLLPAGKGFSGELVIGRDLMQIGVGQAAASPQKG